MFFYSNPALLIEEMKDKSVLITEHRYTKAYDQSATSGKYCVQFMTFKNNPSGMEVLQWWRNACIEWCYARHEDGKFGDQKYLDDWTTRFECVHELQHLGGGIAPWNVQQYTFSKSNSGIVANEISTNKKFPVVFFHYHGLKFYENEIVSLTDEGYDISSETIEVFFKPYVKLLDLTKAKIKKISKKLNSHGISGPSPYGEMGLATIIKYYFNGIKISKRNVFGRGISNQMKHHYYYKTTNF